MLRRLIDSPLKDVDVVLASPGPKAIYSGMVPGVVAGHYQLAETQIDLVRLAERAGAKFVLDRAIALRAGEKSVSLEKSGSLGYDLLSLDVGSLPDTRVPGSAEHALAAKPFEQSIGKMKAQGTGRVAVVGGGAAGVEMAMALRHASPQASVTLYSDRPMFSGRMAERIRDALQGHGVTSRENTQVRSVEAGPAILTDGARESFDLVLWTAGAAPLPWLRDSGLACDECGFVLADRSLRSVSHAEVFAAGDCATLRHAPHPKSGVYAVRQAPVLAENLRRVLQGSELVRYEPQRKSLVLLSCGAKYAIAARGGWSAEGAWTWRWKDWIDRRWVGSFG